MWLEIPSYSVARGMLLAWDPSVVNKEELVGSYSISVRFMDYASGFKGSSLGSMAPPRCITRICFRKNFFMYVGIGLVLGW